MTHFLRLSLSCFPMSRYETSRLGRAELITNISRRRCCWSIVARLTDVCTFRTKATVYTPDIPFTTIRVSFRFSAAAIRASSCVNLSNRLRASSISFSPRSFFKYFSDHRLANIYISPKATHSPDPVSSLLLRSQRCSGLQS